MIFPFVFRLGGGQIVFTFTAPYYFGIRVTVLPVLMARKPR